MQTATLKSIQAMLIALDSALDDGLKPKTFSSIQAMREALGSALNDELLPASLPKIHEMREAHAPPQFTAPFPPLALVSKPNLTTAELAYYSNMAEQSWRVKACYDSAPEGLRPLRVCGKLAWPTAGAKKLLGVS